MMPLFSLNLPANAAVFFGILTDLAAFNMLPTDQFYNTFFPELESADPGAFSENFDALGYSSTFFLYNIGSLILALLAIPILIAVSYVFKIIAICSKTAQRMYFKLKKKIFWGHSLSILFESYSVLAASVVINSTHVSKFKLVYNSFQVTFDSVGEIVNSAFFILFALIVYLAPLAILALLSLKFKQLEQPTV